MTLGIVGHEAAKFTPETEETAREAINGLIWSHRPVKIVSGGCHLGGIDIWAVEAAKQAGIPWQEFVPTVRQWEPFHGYGFKQRNIDIATAADHVVCIVVSVLPPSYTGMHFPICYHCRKTDHVKSGGCWTAKYAERLGKTAEWIVI